jgi:4-amino-4-deoxy-L-arabinose transferase-like glycosyltransferase
LGAGLVFGLASITVASVLSFVIAAVGWLLWQRRPLLLVGAFVLGVLLIIAPITWRNHVIGDDQVLISYNSGVNFYIGNNAQYERTLKTRPGWEWDDLIGQPVAAGIKRPSEKSTYFWKKGWNYIRAQPLDYLVSTNLFFRCFLRS